MSSDKSSIPVPRLTIDRLCLERIRQYVTHCDIEVSGFGFAVQKDGGFHIDDVRVVKQDSAGAAHTDINSEALNKLMAEWARRDGVLVWWHSHVNMSAFWSGTDEATIKSLGRNGACIAIVMNKKFEQRVAMAFKVSSMFHTEATVVMVDNVPMQAVLQVEPALIDTWKAELKAAMPEPRKWETSAGSQLGFGHHSGLGEDWSYYERRANYIVPNIADHTGNRGDYFSKNRFWGSAEEANSMDIDFMNGCQWSDVMHAWRKSKKQLIKEGLEEDPAKRTGVGSPSAAMDSEHDRKRKFAQNDDDIVMYLPITNQFELLNGIKVDADWYMSASADKTDPGPGLLADMEVNGMSEQDLEDLYQQTRREFIHGRP